MLFPVALGMMFLLLPLVLYLAAISNYIGEHPEDVPASYRRKVAYLWLISASVLMIVVCGVILNALRFINIRISASGDLLFLLLVLLLIPLAFMAAFHKVGMRYFLGREDYSHEMPVRSTIALSPLWLGGSFLMWYLVISMMPQWYDWPRLLVAGQQTSAEVISIGSRRYRMNRREYSIATVTYAFLARTPDGSTRSIRNTRDISNSWHKYLLEHRTVTIWYDPTDPQRSNIAGNIRADHVFSSLFFCFVSFIHGIIVFCIAGWAMTKIKQRLRSPSLAAQSE